MNAFWYYDVSSARKLLAFVSGGGGRRRTTAAFSFCLFRVARLTAWLTGWTDITHFGSRFAIFFSHCGRRWPKPKLRSINRRIDRLITQRGPLTRYNYVLLTTLHEKLAKLRAFAIDRLTDWRKKKRTVPHHARTCIYHPLVWRNEVMFDGKITGTALM